MTALLRVGRSGWATLVLATLLTALIFHQGIAFLVHSWSERPEYGYAFLIPLITAFLIWQRRDLLVQIPFVGSWAGAVTVVLGLALFIVGQLSTLYVVQQYALLIVIFGAVLAYTGWRAMSILWAALLLLLFMVPLPDFLNIQLSQKLQLLSSWLGVALIRLFGVSVFLEGNVIDLGTFQLQVAEACSGLRYLFPLMTLGFLLARFYRAPLWRRLALFAMTIPITVLMNSVRIGIIGVLVDRFGIEQAQGFLHDFEGWAVFMACLCLLLLLMWALARASGDHRPWRELLAVELPASQPRTSLPPARAPAWTAVALLALATIPAVLLPQRAEAIPTRSDFGNFPLQLGDWSGTRGTLERVYIAALKFSDYVLVDYRRGDDLLNLYVSYYDSQRNGESAHSPRVCLPGGGWEIQDFGERVLPGVVVAQKPLRVNRAVIALGNQRQLVYYWFQQRGRIITNEYFVKWYLFWDALTRNRSDGAMIRLLTPITAQGEAQSDAALTEFTRTLEPSLATYLPE